MWDTRLALKFQLMKPYFSRARGLKEISHSFKFSSGGYYPQYTLIENYCVNIEGSRVIFCKNHPDSPYLRFKGLQNLLKF